VRPGSCPLVSAHSGEERHPLSEDFFTAVCVLYQSVNPVARPGNGFATGRPWNSFPLSIKDCITLKSSGLEAKRRLSEGSERSTKDTSPVTDTRKKAMTVVTSTLKCVGKRMSGFTGHEAISHLWWVRWEGNRAASQPTCSTRQQMVEYIEAQGPTSVWCPDRNPTLTGAWVHVHNNGRIKYVQTVADGLKTDNLLSLPDM
jgi:hypothetical protein